MRHSKLIAVLLTASMLTACTEPDGSPGRGVENGGALSNQDVGVAVGAVGGGVAGAFIGAGWVQVAAIAGGALLGGALGGVIGHSMDKADRIAYDRASQHAMETGETETWKNPHTGHSGIVHRWEESSGAWHSLPRRRWRVADCRIGRVLCVV